MKIVDDEKGLLASATGPCHYLRLKHDHPLCIHSQTGELYRRADGQPWAQGGYWITRTKHDRNALEIAPANGYCDHTVYRVDRANAA